jgi:hypothetical protein
LREAVEVAFWSRLRGWLGKCRIVVSTHSYGGVFGHVLVNEVSYFCGALVESYARIHVRHT